jgi:hypothetical protein
MKSKSDRAGRLRPGDRTPGKATAWGSLAYAATVEAADDETAAIMAEVWNAKVRSARAQGSRAKAKAAPFDQQVLAILASIEQRRGRPVPARGRVAIVSAALLRSAPAHPDSLRRRVRESLRRQRLLTK